VRIISILILTFNTVFAGQITGTVSDSLSQRPLSLVTVVIKDKNILTYSDSSGAFIISNLASGDYTIYFKRIGYGEVIHNVYLKGQENKELEISLSETPIPASTIVIEGNKWNYPFYDPLRISKEISAARIINTPGGFEDPLRSVQNISGAQARHDYSSQFYIHGSSPEQHAVVLDGLLLNNAYRLKFMNLGGLSIFNLDILKSVNVIKGGYDASVGNRLGAQIELQSSEAGAEWQNRLSVNLLSSRYSLRGPLSNKISTTFSIRRTYYDWLINTFSEEAVVYPFFFDFYNKWSWQLSDAHRLSFIQMLGKEGAKLSKIQNENFETDMRSQSLNSTSHLVLSGYFNDHFKYRLIAAWQFNTDSMQFSGLFNQYSNSKTEKKTLEADFNYDSFFCGGLSLDDIYQSANIYMNYLNKYVGVPDSFVNYRIYSSYVQTNLIFNKKLFINLGYRVEYSDLLKTLHESPRFSFVYNFDKSVRLKGRTGLYYQFPELSGSYFSEMPLNLVYELKDMLPIKSHYSAIAIDYDFNNFVQSEVEFFYRISEDIPEGDLTKKETIILNRHTPLGGDTKAWGVDFSLKFNPGNLNLKLDYSYTHSQIRKDKYLEYSPLYFDQRHWFNGNIDYRITSNWLFSTSFKAGSGFPHKSIIGFVPKFLDKPEILYSQNYKYEPYFRWDARINYEIDFFSIYFELLNITDAKNFDSSYKNSDDKDEIHSFTIYNIYMMPRLPVFGFSLQF